MIIPALKDKTKDELTSFIQSKIKENHAFRKDELKNQISNFVNSYKKIYQQPISNTNDERRAVATINAVLDKFDLPYKFIKIKGKGSRENLGWYFEDKTTQY